MRISSVRAVYPQLAVGDDLVVGAREQRDDVRYLRFDRARKVQRALLLVCLLQLLQLLFWRQLWLLQRLADRRERRLRRRFFFLFVVLASFHYIADRLARL